MNRTEKRMFRMLAVAVLAVLAVKAITPKDYKKEYLDKLNNSSVIINKSSNTKTTSNQVVKETIEPKEVRFTSYWVNDGTGSGNCTSSGLCTSDFDVNHKGWFTYQGKVVLASATYKCFYEETGACGKYNSLPDGYNIHNLHDELTIFIDGEMHDAIVLDSCGASFWEEERQRYDIFVSNEDSKKDIVGYIEWNK